MDNSDKIANVILVLTGSPTLRDHPAVLQLVNVLQTECPALSLSQLSLIEESQVAHLVENIQTRGAAISAVTNLKTGHNTTDNLTNQLIIVCDQYQANQDARGLSESMVAATRDAGVPVIAMHIGTTDSGRTFSDSRIQGEPNPAKSKATGKPRYRTANIRGSYQPHDVALLARQCLSLLGMELLPASQLLPYPLAPQKPGDAVALDSELLIHQLADTAPEWELQTAFGDTSKSQETAEITRCLRFRSFHSAIQYMHQVAPACDVANHHPRWENNWRTLHIWLTTWDASQQITQRDIQLARYFDFVYSTSDYTDT